MKKRIAGFLIIGLVIGIVFLYSHLQQEEYKFPEGKAEFDIQGLVWRTISYYSPGSYKELYSQESNLRFILKAKNIGANYLLIRVFYNGSEEGGLIGNDTEAELYLKEAVSMAHGHGIKILLTPYVESRDYWVKKSTLPEEVWTHTVLKWAKFAEENNVEMFAPGVEMSLILDEVKVGKWFKEILPEIRRVYSGKVITAEHYDIERWKILDEHNSFAGYDCIGLTIFPRKEYDGVSDIRSFEDYREYVEDEARTMDMLSEKYNIECKLAVPLGLDYWKGSYPKNPLPDATIIAEATDMGLDILKEHNFTGVFISHWASEPDHFGDSKEVENMLKKRWINTK
jgi:hypothetical protein